MKKANPNAIAFVYWMDRRDPKQMVEIERANHGFIVGASGRTARAMLAYLEATGDERSLRFPMTPKVETARTRHLETGIQRGGCNARSAAKGRIDAT